MGVTAPVFEPLVENGFQILEHLLHTRRHAVQRMVEPWLAVGHPFGKLQSKFMFVNMTKMFVNMNVCGVCERDFHVGKHENSTRPPCQRQCRLLGKNLPCGSAAADPF